MLRILKIFLIFFMLWIIWLQDNYVFPFQNIITEGRVGESWVSIDGEEYVLAGFESAGRKKKIAKIDGWSVYEVKEDPSQTFLELRSFNDNLYIVKADYTIPTEGNVSCVYVNGGKRIDDQEILDAFTKILSTDYEDGRFAYIPSSFEPPNWVSCCVGYEDCPVGTDSSIYGIAKIDTKWIVKFRKKEGDKTPVVYYELDEEISEAFENNKKWNHYFK